MINNFFLNQSQVLLFILIGTWIFPDATYGYFLGAFVFLSLGYVFMVYNVNLIILKDINKVSTDSMIISKKGIKKVSLRHAIKFFYGWYILYNFNTKSSNSPHMKDVLLSMAMDEFLEEAKPISIVFADMKKRNPDVSENDIISAVKNIFPDNFK